MKVTLQKQESNQVCLEVEVEAKQVAETYERKFKEVSQRVNVPGFRKGKAPKKIIEKYIQQDALKQDVIEHLISESYSEALKNLEQPLEPIAEPKIELVKFDLDQPLVFKATLEVKPDVKLGEYKNIELNVEKLPNPTEKDVEEELEALVKRHGELVLVEDRAVKENDVVTLDIYGEVEGEPIPQGTTDNLAMEVKPGNFVPGFAEQLVGINLNEEKSIDVTFPDTYPVVDLREKQGTFKVFVKEIKELKVPELNDEFAKHMGEGHMHGEINNLEDLKIRLRTELERNNESAQLVKNQQSLIEAIVNGAEVDIPDTMIKRELYAMWSNSEGKALSEKNIGQDVLQASWENWTAREDMLEESRKRIKTTLVLSEVAKAENLSISGEELNKELNTFSGMYQIPLEQLREQLIKNNRMIPLIDELLSLKIINWIESNSKVNVISDGEKVTGSAEEAQQPEEAKVEPVVEDVHEEKVESEGQSEV